jgi:ribosome biogenesis GTPase / thiamine phosphate phosphatase
LTGTVITGTKNRFSVECGDAIVVCGIKGKVLKGSVGFYNPLAPGDTVEFSLDEGSPGTGLITSLKERRNAFSRWNIKGDKPQVLAANIDWLCCVATPDEPPFRPRFLDRCLVLCEEAGIRPLIVLNKADLEISEDVEERMADFERIGYLTNYVSALTGKGIPEFVSRIAGSTVAFVGQSGVGKTSLLNLLCPGRSYRVSALVEKYGRGSHTTTLARLERASVDGTSYSIVDTPGIRNLALTHVARSALASLMPEFRELANQCSYSDCSHTIEPGCKIMEAVYAGYIHEDRYESFLRIREELGDGY